MVGLPDGPQAAGIPAECDQLPQPVVEDQPLRAMRGRLADPRGTVKRAEDIVLGSLLLLLACPVMAVIAVAVRMSSPGPVLFRQSRVGLDNRPFNVLKFRTMYTHLADPHAARQTSRNDLRVTRLGAILRRTSLDELPQLFNVLAGSMSLVGPRPHAPGTTVDGIPLEQALPHYHLRHGVKPGITGLAQVRGNRGELDSIRKLARRLRYDLSYRTRWSVGLDLWILWRTVAMVLFDPEAY